MNDTKVAVITRTKNRPALLKRALESVHSQTYKNFIHVVINDAGDTGAVNRLIEGQERLDSKRIKVIHNKESKGMEAASNKAIRSVESYYIAIHDDDDTWHPEFLERTVKSLEEADSRGVVVKTDKINEKYDEDSGKIEFIKKSVWMPDLKVVNLYRQCIDNQMTPITFLYTRQAYEEIGGYDEGLPVLGDWDFGIRFLKKYDVGFLDPGFALAGYHHRDYKEGSASSNSFGQGAEKHRYYSNKLMNKYLREELAEGRLGAGYIMSKLKYEQSYLSKIASRVMPKFISNRLKSRIQY